MKRLPPPSKYPKKIYVRNQAYDLVFDDALEDFGITYFEEKKIKIKGGMSPRETLSTVIHECLHAIVHEENLKGISHKRIYRLEKALHDFFLDNFL